MDRDPWHRHRRGRPGCLALVGDRLATNQAASKEPESRGALRLRPQAIYAQALTGFERQLVGYRESVLEIRKDNQIHEEEGGWFFARWHFSFDQYRDPAQLGIGPLRVFNHDRLAPGAVWPLHPHRDVEGITYVWKGAFKHEDSLGNGGTLLPGGVQLMTLGSGALHSEQNGSVDEPMEFIQLWILPDTPDLTPEVQQKQFTKTDRQDRLLQVIGSGAESPIRVHQDAAIYVSSLSPGNSVSHSFPAGRGGYLYLIEGVAKVNGEAITGGDAVKITGEPSIEIRASGDSELILVDVSLQFHPVGVWAR